MRIDRVQAAGLLCLVFLFGCGQFVGGAQQPATTPDQQPTVGLATSAPAALASPVSSYTPVSTYDPARDPAQDLQEAIGEAQRTKKRILLVVGGDWCSWCHIMDRFLKDHMDLKKLRDEHFVTMKVNFSEENQNKAFLGKYPEIPGYPHVYVLDNDGTLLHSQDTAKLEHGETYDLEKFRTFLDRWAPPRSTL